MREIEVKILEINRKAIEQKLRAFGAKKIFDGPVDIRMYDTPDRELKRKEIILRLRKKGTYGELTVKTDFTRTARAKTSLEHETRVDFDATQKMLKALGYCESFRMKKHRIEYAFGKVRFEIDKISGIPWFLEIEAPSEKVLALWVKKLGYAQKDTKSWWWHEVLEHYGNPEKRKR